jgi:mycoredoxin
MNWGTLFIIALSLGLVFHMNRSNKTTAVVTTEHPAPIPVDAIEAIEYFWRPGWPFCARLSSGLASAGIPVNERNIWENPEDADIVRSIADGNETVPTVIVGPIGMVNPSVKQVQDALHQHAPHLL